MKLSTIFLIQIVFILTISKVKSSPFLFSTSRWVYQRLFNGTADHSTQNIEDLSEEGPIFPHKNKTSSVSDLRKAARLNNERMDVNSKNFNSSASNMDEETPQPGILHRKISKILNKLQLYSAVRSTIHNVRKQQEETQKIPFDESTMDTKMINEEPNMENSTDNDLESSEEFNKLQRILNKGDATKVDASVISNLSYLPVKPNEDKIMDRDSNESNDDDGILFPDFPEDEVKRQSSSNKLSLELGNFGVHIMEIVGSIATIFLTAAYQVGHYASSLTQAPVTTPPIDGIDSFDFKK